MTSNSGPLRRALCTLLLGIAALWAMPRNASAQLDVSQFTFQAHSVLWSAVFSPDGRRLLTASFDTTARLWEAESGKLLATFQGQRAVFRSDERRVLTASADRDFAAAAAYNNRGNAKKAKGDWDGAIADFTKAIELKPGAFP